MGLRLIAAAIVAAALAGCSENTAADIGLDGSAADARVGGGDGGGADGGASGDGGGSDGGASGDGGGSDSGSSGDGGGSDSGSSGDGGGALDSDDDGVPDSEDAFPTDATESVDSDGDGVGDNGDAFPNDANESADSDGDGVGDNGDAFPNDASESVDSDGDGVGDNSDAFPNDASESVDSDGDGVGDNGDAFPNNGDESADSDGDGTGDNADAFPNDATRACAEGAWDHDSDPVTACVARTVCVAGQYVVSEGSASADRVCGDCAVGTYSDAENAESCSDWTVCTTGQYVSTAGTATSDRECAACTGDTYTSTENAESCTSRTVCVAGQYVTSDGDFTADRECAACTGDTYTSTENAGSCTSRTVCVAGQYVTSDGDFTADRECAACTGDTYTATENADSCAARTVCAAGQYVSSDGDFTTDRACGACDSNNYSTTENAPFCTDWTPCDPGFEEDVAGSSTSDRTCKDIDECDAASDPCAQDGDATGSCTNTVGGFDCACDTGFVDRDGCVYPESCSDLQRLDPSAPSGDYTLDVDGAGGLDAFDASCDMDTDGGGWTLVLNYVHQGGTNPDLDARSDTLPLLGTSVLGDDDSADPAVWGHAAPALMAEVSGDQLRFYGETSSHGRVIDFVTTLEGCLDYFRTGAGSCSGIESDNQELSGHSANVPDQVNSAYADRGDEAMTSFPFYRGAAFHWGIRGNGGRWEVDDYPNNATQDTVHRIWVRDTPRADCVTILGEDPGAADGEYVIDPDGPGGAEPFMAYCDMTTEGGGWTLCGNIDEVDSGALTQCVAETTTYVDHASLTNYSFCLGLFNDRAPGEMMIHNRTAGDTAYGENDRLFFDWSADPIEPGNYDNKSVVCYHLDDDGSTVTDYPDCQYSSHGGNPWQQAMWSFTDGLDNGYSGNFPSRITLGPTYSTCGSGHWYNFGGGTNDRTTIYNDWGTGMYNVGDLYLR